MFFSYAVGMDHAGTRDFNHRRRRDEKKRCRVEAAVNELTIRYGLSADAGEALSEGIYGLYRKHVAQKVIDDQDRQYRKWAQSEMCELALRTANASDAATQVSAYVVDTRDLAARMIRLETLERRKLGRGKTIEQASNVTWADLSPQEKRKARHYLADNVLSGDKTRKPAQEVMFLRSVADLIQHATGRRIRFSSNALGSSRARHHGVEFNVMMAAAGMADYQLTNEAMARLIQRMRRH
jgi:hypothetical protein